MLITNSNKTIASRSTNQKWEDCLAGANQKPLFIEQEGGSFLICPTDLISQIVRSIPIVVNQFMEDDGSITLAPADLDLVDNGKTLEAAIEALIDDLIDYANEYLAEFELYSKASNRKDHLRYVMKILTADSRQELKDALIFHPEKI